MNDKVRECKSLKSKRTDREFYSIKLLKISSSCKTHTLKQVFNRFLIHILLHTFNCDDFCVQKLFHKQQLSS